MIILLVKCSQLIEAYQEFQSTIVYKHLLQQQSHCEHSVLKDLCVTLITTRTANCNILEFLYSKHPINNIIYHNSG